MGQCRFIDCNKCTTLVGDAESGGVCGCVSISGTSLVVQWLRLCAPHAGGLGLIPGQGTRSYMHAATKNSHTATEDPTHHNEDPACRN